MYPMSKKPSKSEQTPSNRLTGILLVLGVAMFAYLVSLFDFFQGLELKLYDLSFQRRGPIAVDSTDIAIVALDQHTADSLAFPFDRRYYGELVTKLKALGAKLVVFDVLFVTESPKPESDSLFKQAIADAGNVILCGDVTRTYQHGLDKPLESLVPPHPSIMPPGTLWGLVNDFHDPDGVARRYPLFLTFARLGLSFTRFEGIRGRKGHLEG